MITEREKEIIINSCRTADAFGFGRITVSRENIIDEEYEWTKEHELFIFTEIVGKNI